MIRVNLYFSDHVLLLSQRKELHVSAVRVPDQETNFTMWLEVRCCFVGLK